LYCVSRRKKYVTAFFIKDENMKMRKCTPYIWNPNINTEAFVYSYEVTEYSYAFYMAVDLYISYIKHKFYFILL
jgi:hypothetical protein